jgi:sugar/nucleoside kinase (ribokinase family)
VTEYKTIKSASSDEFIVKKSRFIGYVKPVKTQEEALEFIAQRCELAVVKIGVHGALIKHRDTVTHVGIMAAAKRVDTTGAGDFYAAGFMTDLCSGLTLRQCGTLGAIAAGKVIEIVGTTLSDGAWREIEALSESVRTEQYIF